MYTKELCEVDFHKDEEEISIGGCYYIAPYICKDITITAGVRGDSMPDAIKKLRKDILEEGYYIKDIIPTIENINSEEIISCYASEFAECLINAASHGKGIEIAVGYPKLLVFAIN